MILGKLFFVLFLPSWIADGRGIEAKYDETGRIQGLPVDQPLIGGINIA